MSSPLQKNISIYAMRIWRVFFAIFATCQNFSNVDEKMAMTPDPEYWLNMI